MAYIVKAFTPGKLNLAPETLEEEVLQNVAIIVSTPKFSVPLDSSGDSVRCWRVDNPRNGRSGRNRNPYRGLQYP